MPPLRSPSPGLGPQMLDPFKRRNGHPDSDSDWPNFMGAATPWYAEPVAALAHLPTAVRRHFF